MLQISGVPETLKVKEHLELYRSYYPHPLPMKALLEASGLMGLENRLYGKLSGGQKQRLHLAIAMCGNPDLIFLDEPTTGLDVTSRRALWEQVRTLIGKGRTVVLTTHYLEEADALADRVAVMDKGRIIANGSPAEIKAKTSGQKIRAITSLPLETIKALPGVSSVHQEGAGIEILTSKAESVVLSLLQKDKTLSGLEVSSAGLEDAFLALTRPEAS
jgi:ABC-2 type transport system ATP-binding protein